MFALVVDEVSIIANPIAGLLLLQAEAAHTSHSTVNVSESEIAIVIAMTMTGDIMTAVDTVDMRQTEWRPRRC